MHVSPTADRMCYEVTSESGQTYTVDLLGMGGAACCLCEDWQMRRYPALRRGEPTLTDKTTCKHVRAALTHFTRELLKQLSEKETKP